MPGERRTGMYLVNLKESEVSCSEWSPKGRYRVISQSGVTAWMPNSATKEQKGGGPYPYQFTFFKPDTLAGFLEARGIDEPIHFMVCEDFLPGLAPQVMTQSGEIKPLQWGCIREISLGGTMRDRWFGSDLPRLLHSQVLAASIGGQTAYSFWHTRRWLHDGGTGRSLDGHSTAARVA